MATWQSQKLRLLQDFIPRNDTGFTEYVQNNTPYKKICPEIPNNIRQSKKITIGMDETSDRTWEGYLLRDALLYMKHKLE